MSFSQVYEMYDVNLIFFAWQLDLKTKKYSCYGLTKQNLALYA